MSDAIQFYSDFNCPFCYALNERLIAIGDGRRVEWRGIEHEASATSQVVTADEKNQLLNEVSVIRKRAPEIVVHVPPFRPNTRLANLAVYSMREQEATKLSLFRTEIYRALWVEGRDISDPLLLRELADQCGLLLPALDPLQTLPAELAAWQQDWEGDQFKTRLPVMYSAANNKPLLGFPTYDLLYHYFNGRDLPIAPETLAACQLKPRQTILLIGQPDTERCNLQELEAAYFIQRQGDLDSARSWLQEQDCAPDLILLDYPSLGEAGLALCGQLKREHGYRHCSLIVLLDGVDGELELRAFDSGASDVLFDLSHPKVAQARLDAQLRAKQSQSILDALAKLDYLTELPNRREFDRKLEDEWLRACRSQKPLALILMDIDHFKAYNDHYGHSMGDDCLRQVAKAMSVALKRSVDLVARYGGEEFAAVLPDTDSSGAMAVAEQLRQRVLDCQIPHQLSQTTSHVSISLGVAATQPALAQMPDSLIKSADDALYQAKAAGRNRAMAFQAN